MRLWTVHPRYLDTKGLLAAWREGLLAQKVLQDKTSGYRNHPQLLRFRATANPTASIASYLLVFMKKRSNADTISTQTRLMPRGSRA